jgi:hypothetical protein
LIIIGASLRLAAAPPTGTGTAGAVLMIAGAIGLVVCGAGLILGPWGERRPRLRASDRPVF